MRTEQQQKLSPNFIPPKERPVQPGLSEFQPERPVVDVEVVTKLPGRIFVGRVDTTRGTIK